mgnify:CR=1 FL=1
MCRRAVEVAQPVAPGGEQPCLRVVRHATVGPGRQRPLERVGQCVLGGGDVSVRGREEREQAPVRGTGRPLRLPVGPQGWYHCRSRLHVSAVGRTSTVP